MGTDRPATPGLYVGGSLKAPSKNRGIGQPDLPFLGPQRRRRRGALCGPPGDANRGAWGGWASCRACVKGEKQAESALVLRLADCAPSNVCMFAGFVLPWSYSYLCTSRLSPAVWPSYASFGSNLCISFGMAVRVLLRCVPVLLRVAAVGKKVGGTRSTAAFASAVASLPSPCSRADCSCVAQPQPT